MAQMECLSTLPGCLKHLKFCAIATIVVNDSSQGDSFGVLEEVHCEHTLFPFLPSMFPAQQNVSSKLFRNLDFLPFMFVACMRITT